MVSDVPTDRAVISAIAKSKHQEHALHLFKEMQRQGVMPDMIT